MDPKPWWYPIFSDPFLYDVQCIGVAGKIGNPGFVPSHVNIPLTSLDNSVKLTVISFQAMWNLYFEKTHLKVEGAFNQCHSPPIILGFQGNSTTASPRFQVMFHHILKKKKEISENNGMCVLQIQIRYIYIYCHTGVDRI